LNKKSFFNFFKNNDTNFFFGDTYDSKEKNYLKLDLEKKNDLKFNFKNILIFNVLEHVFDIDNAILELKEILDNEGKIYISTPFIYRYHQAPSDYNRYTLDYFEKISEKHDLEVVYKNALGTGPFFAAYSIVHGLINKLYPLNIIFAGMAFFFDWIIKLVSKDIKNIYPISIFIVLKKK
jgi:SAM-dependent methyltransferase